MEFQDVLDVSVVNCGQLSHVSFSLGSTSVAAVAAAGSLLVSPAVGPLGEEHHWPRGRDGRTWKAAGGKRVVGMLGWCIDLF